MARMVQWTPYTPPESLWTVIELYAPTVELSEIKYIIGDDLVEQSNELFAEVQMLLDIWELEAHSTPAPARQNALPENPYLREQVVAQIQQFVNNFDATKNRMLQGFLNDRKTVYDYAVSRPRTANSSTSGRSTPSRPASRSTTSTPDITSYR